MGLAVLSPVALATESWHEGPKRQRKHKDPTFSVVRRNVRGLPEIHMLMCSFGALCSFVALYISIYIYILVSIYVHIYIYIGGTSKGV